jgi:hypothetical protein
MLNNNMNNRLTQTLPLSFYNSDINLIHLFKNSNDKITMKNSYISRHLATSKIFFACILCFLLAGISTTVNAQVTVSGSTGANGTYSTLGGAFTAINNNANQSSNNIEIQISANIDEDQNNGSTLNAGTWTTLKIYPTATAIVTGPSNLGGNKAVINLNGADNVTIDGRLNQTGAISLTLQALGQNTVNVIKFSNSAIFNTIKFCTLKGKSNNNDCGLINFSTSPNTSGNSFNTIDNCNITSISDNERSVYGIYSAGISGFENSNNTIINNKFYNFGNADRQSAAIYVKEFSNTFIINGNHFFQPVTAPSSSYAMSYIYINTGYDYTITNNYMGGTSTYCGGTAPTLTFSQSGSLNFCPIYLNVGKDYPTNVQNNTIQNLDISCMDPAFSAIYVVAGAVNIANNTIGSATIAQSIKINSVNQNDAKSTYVIKIDGVDNVYIKNNIIGGIYTSATTYSKPHSLYAIYKRANAGNLTVTGNTIGSETVTNSMYTSNASNNTGNRAGTDNRSNVQQLVGIYTAGTDINLINENTIANLTNANTYNNSGDNKNNLAIYTTGGSNTIKDNTIHDINAPMYFVGGIYQASATANSAQIISNNTIYNLFNTSTSQAVRNTGIYNASSGITCSLATNYIYGLKVGSPDTGSYIDGIDLAAGNINCYNNIVNLGQNTTQPSIILGINDYGTNGTNNIYHNTVYINGSTSGTPIGTTAFFRGNNTGTGNVRNNIFRNARTGGSNYAAFINTNKTILTIDYNDYYVDGTNSTFAYLNGTTLTSADILTNLDTNSKIDKPLFTNTTPIQATDFRLITQMKGTNLLTTVPTDFEGITRTTPTMGAWENGFVSLAPSRYFTYIFGKGPSAEQMFVINASGLSADMTITPPTNFEISPVSGGVFTLLPITIKQTGGIINDTIYIRLKAGLTVGPYGPESIALTSGTTQNVICNGYVIPAVAAGGGGSYCSTETIKLTSTTSGGLATNTFWTGPNNYYSTDPNPQIAPTLTAANAGAYTVTTSYLAGNELIANSGFEATGTQPVSFTNSYTYVPAVTGTGKSQTTELWPKDTYTITDIPYWVHYDSNYGRETDYTTTGPHGGTKQMVVNGSGKVAWSQQVTLEPYSTYQLSFWLLNVTGAVSPAKIYVDGLEISPIYSAPSSKGAWSQVIYNLPMANVTSVKLELRNVGNSEFGLDDISLKKVYTSSSSVDVSVIVGTQAPNVAITASPGTTVDAGTSITFTATPYNGGTAPTYQWNLNGAPITGATGVTYTYVPTDKDEISCTMTSTSNCTPTNTKTVTSTKITMTVNTQRNFWKGNIDTNWFNKYNWTATKVPEEGEAVAFSKGTPYGDAQKDLLLDKDRTIGSFTNEVSGLKLIIPPATCLTVNGTIDTDLDPNRILIKAYPDGTQQNGSLIFKNANNVYGSVEMYTQSYRKTNPANEDDEFFWQYFGIPVESIKADPTFYGAYVRKANEAGDETDEKYYWTELDNNSNLNAFDGYEICQTLDSKGLFFQGQLVNRNFSKTLIYSPGASVKYPGQHLLANPYVAAINVNKINFGSDIEAHVSLYKTGSYGQWSAAGNGVGDGSGPGQFTTIPKLPAGNNGLPQEVPSMSSMLVRVASTRTDANSVLSFNYKDVITKNTTLQKVKAIDGLSNTDLISTRIDLTGQHYSDRMWIFTEQSCTRNFDNGWDGRKMLGSSLAPQIYAMEPDGDYQVNSVSDMNNTDLAFQAGDEVEYTLKFTHENVQRQYAGVYLVDLVENKTVDVSQNGSTYTFATAQSDAPAKRFKILTRPYEKGAPDMEAQVKIFAASGRVFVHNLSAFKGECTLYDIAGRATKNATFEANAVTEVLNNLSPGAYVVNTITNGEKVSKRVIVQ